MFALKETLNLKPIKDMQKLKGNEFIERIYPNLSLGLATKARACKGAGQEGSLGITFHAPGSVGECEGTKLHTPNELPFWELESQ
jgi:hypothetical protein